MTKKRSAEELFILWGMLDIEFLKLQPTSYAKVADQVIDWVLWRERLRNNLEKTLGNQKKSDIKTIAALQSMDTDDTELLALEKVFKRLVNGRGNAAMHLLQASIKNKQNEISARQSLFAREPRIKKRHPLSSMVDPIVEKNPKIKLNTLFNELRAISKNNPSAPCTFDFSKNAFVPTDKGVGSVPRKNLSDYLYRATKRIGRANRLE